MTVIQGMQGWGLARRTVVEFDARYSSCTTTVVLGKQTGASLGYMQPLGVGPMQEIKSATVSGTSCSVKDGNVFGR
jgi:hypothetical protein